MFGKWLAKRRLLRRAGMSAEHARLVGAFVHRFRGVWLLLRPVSPADFLGEEMHPFMPWREAKDRIPDRISVQGMEKDAADPIQGPALIAKIKKAQIPLLCKAILWPPVVREMKPGHLSAEELVDDLELSTKIVEAVTAASLEKKTLRRDIFWRPRRWRLTQSPSGMVNFRTS